MKSIQAILLSVIVLVSSALSAEIIEIDHIKDMEKYVGPKKVILFDIDNTLMEPAQTLGSDQWFQSRIRDYQHMGMDSHNALEEALSEWIAVQSITKVQLVEKEAEMMVRQVQRKGLIAMGLTTRGLGLSTRTVEQLKTLNVDFHDSGPVHHEVFFQNLRGCLFRGGILFTAGTHKGRALFRLFDRIDYHPKSVVFINDKHANLREVEETCEERNIPFLGLRYNYLDQKVKNLRKDLTEIQREHFGHILSDEDAEKILIAQKEKRA